MPKPGKRTSSSKTSKKTLPTKTVRRKTSKRKSGRQLVADEPTLWAGLEAIATGAFDFWHKFLDLRMGAANDQPLNATAIKNFRTIIRCVSWVESKHGSAGANFPARDPMQCGNPADIWWKTLIGGFPKTERFVGGPAAKNYWAEELPKAAAATAGFPATATVSHLGDPANGHKDAKFNSNTSFYWGVPFLIHKINKPPSAATYKCDTATKTRMIDGAVAYNGGGDPKYREKIEAAWKLITGT